MNVILRILLRYRAILNEFSIINHFQPVLYEGFQDTNRSSYGQTNTYPKNPLISEESCKMYYVKNTI